MPLPQSASDIQTYGGKTIDDSPPVDGQTDRSADEVNQAFEDLAQMTRTPLKSIFAFTVSSGVPNVASTAHVALWGSALALIPSVVKAGEGVFNVALPATVTDGLGRAQSVIVRSGWANVSGTALVHASVSVSAANTATVRIFNASGTLADPPSGAVVSVFLV